MRKQGFHKCENKGTDQLRGNYVFVTRIVQSLYLKFQAYSHLLWLCSPVCLGPGRKPQKPVFAQRGSYKNGYFEDLKTKTYIRCAVTVQLNNAFGMALLIE